MKSCCEKKKIRSSDEKKALINRLSRIEGQIRGLKGMVEQNAYCMDILTQASAVSAAIGSFNIELLEAHIRTCVTEDIQNGQTEKTDELMMILGKLLK